MEVEAELDSAYVPSEDVVAREIEGELIIVPLAAGIGDVEDEIYTLNETGRAIWGRLDGRKSLRKVAQELGAEYGSPAEQLEKDVLGFVSELLRRRMLVESTRV